MKKILITGISGFVGHHFLQFLYNSDEKVQVMGIDINDPQYDITCYLDKILISVRKVNMLDIKEVRQIFKEFEPNYVLHLASYSSVAYSWINPTESFMNNTNIFLNLVTVVSEMKRECRILSVGSSEEYGNVSKEDVPIKERLRLRPVSPYAVARVSQEMLSKLYVDSFNLDIIMTRSFNHIGPWQDERFAIPSFVKKIINIKNNGNSTGQIETGNIDIIRDFVDVRDVVRAYWLLLLKGKKGEVYNICSGEGRSLRSVIDIIAEQAGVKITTTVNEKLIRPDDNQIIIGENYKIFDAVGWKPLMKFETTIRDTISSIQEE